MSKNKDNLAMTGSVLEVAYIIAKGRFLHVREIARLAGISPTTAGNILNSLEKRGILSKKALGKNLFYSFVKGRKSLKIITMAEDYRFLCRSSEKQVEDICSALSGADNLLNMTDSILLSKENNKRILVFITTLDADTIKARLGKTGISKIAVFTKENFRNNLGNEGIKKLLADYIVLHGSERFAGLVYP